MTVDPCPRCGGPTDWWFTCHTWPNSDGRWMACQGCDSAAYWYCTNEDCDWSYTHGLNPRNPRSAANEANRPSWITP